MARREVPDDVASAVLDRFTDVGLVDDAEYARMLVRSRHDDRGLARRALGDELRRKGISDELATAALAELDPESERATAQRLVARKLASTRGLDTQVRVRRTLAALGRKGYPPGLVMEVVREYLASEQGADEVGSLPRTLGDGDGDDPDAISGP
ncbi:MAG TPA: regulatory protein RecX [Cellulomonadaceae bacterium]|nr:regulatory protein RecX [Cellulomonadaceae bacterium]